MSHFAVLCNSFEFQISKQMHVQTELCYRIILHHFVSICCSHVLPARAQVQGTIVAVPWLWWPSLVISLVWCDLIRSSTSCGWLQTGWRTKCHTTDCAHNAFLLLQKHLTSGTELILIGWKIVPNEEHVQCDHRFVSQPLANEPFIRHNFSTQVFRKRAAQLHYVGPELRYIFWPT